MSKLLLVVLCVLFLPPPSGATGINDAQITIHLAPAVGNGCQLASAPPPCNSIDVSGGLGNHYAYILVTDGNHDYGIGGLQCGIEYGPSIHVWRWQLCATLDFHLADWPQSNSGNLIIWTPESRCQRLEPGGPGTGVVAVAGYFYLTAYAPSVLSIIPRPVDGEAKVADCPGQESGPLDAGRLGYARFSETGEEPGYNPCSRTPPPPGSCEISGPSAVAAGTTNVEYVAITDLPEPAYTWSVNGSAVIVGSATGQTVQVNAGPPGSFQITISIAGSNGGRSLCGIPVNVTTDFNCTLPCGPNWLAGHDMATYTAPPGFQYEWFGTNLTIVGPADQSSVLVRAGNPGEMTVRLRLTLNGIQASHWKTVTVGPIPDDTPDSQKNAKICLHVTSPTSKNACGASLVSCDAVVPSGDLYPVTHDVYVIVSNGFTSGLPTSGVAGVQFGIEYDGTPHSGVDIYSWTLCADLEFPMPGWPNPGTGTIITWEPTGNCQNSEPGGPGTGVAATAGYFYLTAYTPDVLHIVPRQVDGAAKVANCNAAESILVDATYHPVPSPLGTAGFGQAGFNPCTHLIPVVPTTWSHVKTLFDN